MNRIWIFGSPEAFNERQKNFIEEKLEIFTKDWNAHGNALTAQFALLENRFIKVSVNEALAQASGCSIDSLTHLIQNLEKELGLTLLDRMTVFYKSNDEIQSQNLLAFKQQIRSEPNTNMWVYDLGVATEEAFQSRFCLPLSDSWAAPFAKVIS